MNEIITFKAKKESRYYVDGTLAYEFIKIPKIKKSHLNLTTLRNRKDILGQLANSDLIIQLCQSIIDKKSKNNVLKLPLENDSFKIEHGFLITVKFYHKESES